LAISGPPSAPSPNATRRRNMIGRDRKVGAVSKGVRIDGRESPPHVPPALAAAIAHLKAGDAQAALQAASDACHAAPGLPAAHYAYGQAWAALGEAGRAERAFAEA